MKIRLIIVTKERTYAERFFSGAASKRDAVDIDICTSYDRLDGMLRGGKYDVALSEPEAVDYMDLRQVKLAVLLQDPKRAVSYPDMARVVKYQRISTILSEIQGLFAQVAPEQFHSGSGGRVTVVWSPAGGVGKTTVALASAVRASSDGKKATYLDLEAFSGTPALFQQEGKSLSQAFAHLSGNLAMQLQSIRLEDGQTGLRYFSPPSNFDDMNELTEEDLLQLVQAAAEGSDELVVDLSSSCDKRTVALLKAADRILLVVDGSPVAQAKLRQFTQQNSIYATYQDKMTLVVNKGGSMDLPGVPKVSLQLVHTTDPVSVFTTLSAKRF